MNWMKFVIYGIPTKLPKQEQETECVGYQTSFFYIPEVQGMSQLLFHAAVFISCQMCLSFDWKFNLHIGYENCRCHVNGQDVDFCRQYISPAPPPVPEEFIDVADIAMTHNGWSMPNDCQDALELYLNLVSMFDT